MYQWVEPNLRPDVFLFFLPNGRPRRHFAGVANEEAATTVLGLFFASWWVAATTLLNHYGISQIDNTSISHGDRRTRMRGGNKTR
jgi:hypothetical protein